MPSPNLLDSLLRLPVIAEKEISPDDCKKIALGLEEGYVYELISSVILESEAILALDPRQRRKKILELAAETIVRALGAEAASIRLLEPKTLRMLNFGSYGLEDAFRAAAVPALDSISGLVAQKKSSITVPSILQDPLYKNKEIVHLKGFHSLLAVPLLIPSFIAEKNDFIGSLQIYYKEEHRSFSKLEIIRAEMLARRVSYVLAKKKIIDLYVLNQRKEKIAEKVFLKLSHHESIKLKDIFNMLIQELGELLQLQGCSLFSVTDDRQHIYLEAAYPIEMSYHNADHLFTIAHHPYFESAVYGEPEHGDSQYERVEEQYILIKDPERSRLTSSGLRHFVRRHNIYSILMIPIRVNDNVRHVLAIYATENKKVFSEDEIELLTFLAKEIMKAAKLEYLGETLHDFKNPAVAVAGLASRCHKLLTRTEDLNTIKEKLSTYLDVIAQETSRLQDIALTQTGEGREEIMDLGQVAERRYALNESIIQENRMAHINVLQPEIENGLLVRCPLFSLERVIDNLLHNATKAIPAKGGSLAMKVERSNDQVRLEVANSGRIPESVQQDIAEGRIKGRGLYIIQRFVTSQHGTLQVCNRDDKAVFILSLPLVKIG